MGQEGDIELLIDLGDQIKDSALCGLGQTAPNPILSTIQILPRRVRGAYQGQEVPGLRVQRAFRGAVRAHLPGGTEVPRYIALISNRRFSDALRLIRDKNPFVSVCGRVVQCSVRGQVP